MLAKDEAATDAKRLLERVWDGSRPVDSVLIARKLGIVVYDSELDRDVSGALVKTVGRDPTILLNVADSPNRRRFTCAHEIGHFMRRTDNPDAYEYVEMRNSLSAAGQNLEEVYANAFAANLLMPEDDVRHMWKQGYRETDLMLHFGVSQDAIHYRRVNLGLEP